MRPILKVNYKLFKLFHPTSPWTSPASIKIFAKILSKDMTGFEYGSGNSTIFFSKHLKHLTSVEHDSQWFSLVQKKIKQEGITNVDYHFIPRNDNGTANDQDDFAGKYHLLSDFQIRKNYYEYFSFINKFPDQSLDFVLVDGRARVECALNAIPKLKQGGILVLDNSERERYQPLFDVLAQWSTLETTNGLTNTTFWFKP